MAERVEDEQISSVQFSGLDERYTVQLELVLRYRPIQCVPTQLPIKASAKVEITRYPGQLVYCT